MTIPQNGTQQWLWHIGEVYGNSKSAVSHSILTKIDNRTAVKVTNTTESSPLIKKNTQIAKFSVVTPEQSKFIEQKELAILSLIPQGDPDLIIYLNELLGTNKPEQQNHTFGFLTLKDLANLRITPQYN